jgi:transposase
MYYGRKSQLPIYFNTYKGSINDKTDLEYMIDHTKSLGLKNVLFVIDRGFYTDINLKHILGSKYNFITPLPSSRLVYKNLLQKYSHKIRNNKNKIDNYNIFGC